MSEELEKTGTVNIKGFKELLDGRLVRLSEDLWASAETWADQRNEAAPNETKWSWGCGLKLDYDGDIVKISCRFYPPHKSGEHYMKYHGYISIMLGDAEEYFHNEELEAISLDDLAEKAEERIGELENKIKESIRNINWN